MEQESAGYTDLNLAQQWLSNWQSQQKGELVEKVDVHRLLEAQW